LNLKYVSKLLDTAKQHEFTDVEILQTHSLKDFYFIGVYSKNKNQEYAEMKKLKIIRKKDNFLFQTLDFSKIETPTGNVMTVIFDNVETENKSNNFVISNKIGRMGGYLDVKYNLKKKRFVLVENTNHQNFHQGSLIFGGLAFFARSSYFLFSSSSVPMSS
jgi:hypothetical protein